MKKTVATLLNQQVNKELYSAYLYLEFNNMLADMGLAGFAHWLRIQVLEERDHAMLFYDYLHHNNQKVELEAIEQPKTEAKTVMQILQASLEHEEFITDSIHNIYEAALKEKDYRTKGFLDWFVKEQGEEENNFHTLIDKVKILGEDTKGLYVLDRELATRVYVAPSLTIT